MPHATRSAAGAHGLGRHLSDLLRETVFIAAGITALGGGAAAYLLSPPSPAAEWMSSLDPMTKVIVGIVVVGGIALIAALLAVMITRNRRAALQTGADALVTTAERYAAGEARISQINSGVAEFDAVSDVMVRGAQHLARSLAAERNFSSDASHQLRTPLTSLLMRLEEISYTDDIDVAREEAGIAMEQVERLSGVVDDLLGRSKGGNAPAPAVSLDTILASLQREWQPAFAAARRSIHVSGLRALTVRCRPVDLSQILSTLLENSLHHARGTVSVEARRAGPSVIVEVTDEGEGVSASLAPHIFERSVTSGGSGLGLALARDLAASNGGRLDLVAARPAKFALFLSEARD